MNEKPWYLSRAIWGAIVSIIAILAGYFGYDVDAERQGQIVTTGIAVAGAGVALYGRISATTTLK